MSNVEERELAAGIDWGGGVAEDKGTTDRKRHALTSVHSGLPLPLSHPLKCSLVRGDYLYFHYGCDGQDDRGWGCGYRTVQTMASWLRQNLGRGGPLPSLPQIQQALVAMGDKPASFAGSREWIGTFEASLVLDHFYDTPCRLVHVPGGGARLEREAVEALHRHFEERGCPVMMGGDRDNSSKGVVGVCTGPDGSHLLVVDPHYWGGQAGRTELQRQGWVSWRRVSSLDQNSFYNLCLPQVARGGEVK